MEWGGKRKIEMTDLMKDVKRVLQKTTTNAPPYIQNQLGVEPSRFLLLKIPTDEEGIFYHVKKLYCILSVINTYGSAVFRELGIADPIGVVSKKKMEVKNLRSSGEVAVMTNYDMGCVDGKWSLSTILFMITCQCSLIIQNLIQPLHKAHKEKSITEWAISQHLLLLPKKSIESLTQMELYRQMLYLADKWKEINAPNNNAFYLAELLEQRCSKLVCSLFATGVLDGSEPEFTKYIQDKKAYCVSLTYIDDMSCMFSDMDRSYFIIEKLSTNLKESAIVPPEVIAQYNAGFNTWVGETKAKGCVRDFIDQIRGESYVMVLRCGEETISKRINNGVSYKNPQWIIHLRSYYQMIWLQRHATFNKDGSIKNVLPKQWQQKQLVLMIMKNCLGSLGLSIYEDVFFTERTFWKSFKVRNPKNAIVVEVMGYYYVIQGANVMECSSISFAFLVWFLFTSIKGKNYFYSESGLKHLHKMDEYIKMWTGSTNNNSTLELPGMFTL